MFNPILSKIETSYGMLTSPPVTTATVLKGVSTTLIDTLKARVNDIVEKNPWLGGVLCKNHNNNVVIIQGRYQCFQYLPDHNTVSYEYDLQTFIRQCSWYAVQTGWSSIDTDEILFRVSLIPDAHVENQHILIVSMNHLLGDGALYYQIYNMINNASEVISLSPHRPIHLDDAIDKHQGSGVKWFNSWSFLCGVIYTKFFAPASTVTTSYVNLEKVKKFKEKHVGFISTNDILTSCFFNASGCTHGIMPVNLRKRISDTTDMSNTACNCVGTSIYVLDTLMTPLDIRETLQKPQLIPSTLQLPSIRKSCTGKLAAVTNWSTFYKKITVDSHDTIFHVPVADLMNTPIHSVMIIYNNSKCLSTIRVTRDTFDQRLASAYGVF